MVRQPEVQSYEELMRSLDQRLKDLRDSSEPVVSPKEESDGVDEITAGLRDVSFNEQQGNQRLAYAVSA